MSTTYHPHCSLISATSTVAKTGNPGIALVFSVPEVGRRTVPLWLSDAAWPHTEKKLESIGFNGSFEKPEFSNADDVELAANDGEYEGKPQVKWDIAPSGGGFASAPPTNDVLRQLSARWRATHKTGTPAKPTAPAKAPSKAPAKPAAKPLSNATDKDSAWDEYKELNPGVAEDVISERFYASIEKIGDENEFTAKEWQAVVADAVPF